MPTFHLAHLNIGRIRAPMDSPELAEFAAALDPINALADAAPGFVWRLQSESGNATDIKVYDDDLLLVNMSVWESVDALYEYVYRTDHRAYLARRREWFEKMDELFTVMWWVPAGHIPTVEEAKAKLELLRDQGPTDQAFTFRTRFPAPQAEGSAAP